MRAYLFNEQLTDHEFLKELTSKELVQELNGFSFHTEPKHHQLVCLLLAVDYPGFCFFVDMGGGKTKIMLDMIRYRQAQGRLRRTLVVVPYPQNTLTWIDEAKIHAPELKIVSLIGTKAQRDELLSEQADVFVINYMGLFVMMCDLIKSLSPEEQRRNRMAKVAGKKPMFRTGRRMNRAKAELFANLWDCVIFDESQFIGGWDTNQFKLCALLSIQAKYSYCLTGTPFGKDPAPVWPQFFCADMGLTFGQKFTLFRSVFYDVKLTYFRVDYKFNRSHMKDLRRMMRNRSIVYEDVEFADLPPVIYQTIKVQMTEEMRPYYDQRVANLREAWKSRDVRLIENSYIQTRSVTSGFVVGDVIDSEEKIRVRFQFKENPKLEALKSLFTSLPYGRKITVYHEYIFTGDIIYELARQLKLNPARLGGGAKGIANVQKFLEDDECRVLVSQSKAGGVGNNFQGVCNYCCYYETPSSPVVRKQSEKRFPREGQMHKVFIYDLVMDGTIDNDVLSDLHSGIDFANKLLRPRQGELRLGGT